MENIVKIFNFIEDSFLSSEIKECLKLKFEKWYLNPKDTTLRTPINRGDRVTDLKKIWRGVGIQFELDYIVFEITL